MRQRLYREIAPRAISNLDPPVVPVDWGDIEPADCAPGPVRTVADRPSRIELFIPPHATALDDELTEIVAVSDVSFDFVGYDLGLLARRAIARTSTWPVALVCLGVACWALAAVLAVSPASASNAPSTPPIEAWEILR